MALWADEGPASQGKILTAILQDDAGKAETLMRGWSPADLDDLAGAAEVLIILARKIKAVRRGGQ
jgi:hypothetical protein